MPIYNFTGFIAQLLDIYTFVVFANALLSWFVFGTQNPGIRKIYRFTSRIVDPVLSPIRNVLAPVSRNFGIDISPFILIILLQILVRDAQVIRKGYTEKLRGNSQRKHNLAKLTGGS